MSEFVKKPSDIETFKKNIIAMLSDWSEKRDSAKTDEGIIQEKWDVLIDMIAEEMLIAGGNDEMMQALAEIEISHRAVGVSTWRGNLNREDTVNFYRSIAHRIAQKSKQENKNSLVDETSEAFGSEVKRTTET